MKLTQIKEKAKIMGIQFARNIKKIDLIHAIQQAEGYQQCYGTNDGTCPYQNCLWIDDC